MTRITQQLIKRQLQQNTLVCCGLDPDLAKMPSGIGMQSKSDEAKIMDFLTEVVRLTAPHVCAYKPQKAFYDLLPGGHRILRELIAFIHGTYPGIPVMMDCKVGDIDNTMAVYMRNILDVLGADGMVVNPYMGDEVLAPFALRSDKAAVVLVRTSNFGSAVMQEVILQNGEPYWMHTLHLVVDRWNGARNLIVVLSATANLDMMQIRPMLPDEMPILLAGIGAQGGSLAVLPKLLNTQGVGVYINSSRGILYGHPNHGQSWQQSVEEAVIRLKREINQVRGTV